MEFLSMLLQKAAFYGMGANIQPGDVTLAMKRQAFY